MSRLGPQHVSTGALQFAAEVSAVREVSLLGTCELEPWRSRLTPVGLTPLARQGRAQLMVVAAAMIWKGTSFSELSVSILVEPLPDVAPSGTIDQPHLEQSYLLQAWNSNRFFALCERIFFSTPYQHGEVRVTGDPSPSVTLLLRGDRLFQIALDPYSRSARAGERTEDGWRGVIHLPSAAPHAAQAFYAELRGETEVIAFDPIRDSLSLPNVLVEEGGARVLTDLARSGFRGEAWHLRPAAVHRKSKTYRRDRFPQIDG